MPAGADPRAVPGDEPAPALSLGVLLGGTPASGSLSSSDRPRIEVDQLRALYVQSPVALAGNALGILVILAIFSGRAPWPLLGGWALLGLFLLLLRLAHYLRFRIQRRAPDDTLRHWRRSWRWLVLGHAVQWGLAAWIFWYFGGPYQRVALILIVYSYCLSAVPILATQPKLFLAFVLLVFTPCILRIASDSQDWSIQLAAVLTALLLLTIVMARTYAGALGQAIGLKSRTDELAERLRQEMVITEQARRAEEEARRAAEAASQAKTQFFAAASHDLRQPLHAMGLFAEALRQKSRDPEVASLVNSINESVDALEGLFSELLDITRIDTGGVDVNPQPVRLHELFGRLRLHFEPTAFEKGLMLSFHGGQHVAQADPLLLERILRNLVSNSIRYTEDGGLLVSCRPRAGALLVQVWDSGIGISQATLPRIFDEFYQVQGSRPLEAHQRKGLGLGLSIVKRLADLMQAPLSVQSRVGHGTVFSLTVPLGRAPRSIAPQGNATGANRVPLGLTLQGRLFVVVEDELPVREGLVVLLQAWGGQVQAFDSVAALQEWLASAAAQQPDLLLVDYRLQQGITGIEALVAARARWPGQRMPAIVITGSSLIGHEDEAVAHDYHLLIKPVLPGKLRAMIAFKLGVRAAG
jgi:two-component system, sensor histidine kinase